MIITQTQLMRAKKDENSKGIPIHRHFREGGAFHKKAIQDIDGAIVIAEIDKLLVFEEIRMLLPQVQVSTPLRQRSQWASR